MQDILLWKATANNLPIELLQTISLRKCAQNDFTTEFGVNDFLKEIYSKRFYYGNPLQMIFFYGIVLPMILPW